VPELTAIREPSPFGIPSRKLGIWMFIVADAATFAAVLFAYGYMRVANPDWTRPFTFWPTIANGIGVGFIAWVVLRSAAGKVREISPLLWIVAAGFVLYFARGGIESLIGL